MRVKPHQKLVIIEKGTNAIYFTTVASFDEGILKMEIKGVINLKYLSRTGMHIYDMNRFCRYYDVYDFYNYYEEELAHREIVNKSTEGEMSLSDLEKMMNQSSGYLLLRLEGEKKKELTKKEYETQREKYLSLMHLAVNIGHESIYNEWYEIYQQLEEEWKQKEAH